MIYIHFLFNFFISPQFLWFPFWTRHSHILNSFSNILHHYYICVSVSVCPPHVKLWNCYTRKKERQDEVEKSQQQPVTTTWHFNKLLFLTTAKQSRCHFNMSNEPPSTIKMCQLYSKGTRVGREWLVFTLHTVKGRILPFVFTLNSRTSHKTNFYGFVKQALCRVYWKYDGKLLW